jgi:hypothetical protein
MQIPLARVASSVDRRRCIRHHLAQSNITFLAFRTLPMCRCRAFPYILVDLRCSIHMIVDAKGFRERVGLVRLLTGQCETYEVSPDRGGVSVEASLTHTNTQF